jgi:hypothetical protein
MSSASLPGLARESDEKSFVAKSRILRYAQIKNANTTVVILSEVKLADE